MMKTLSTSTHRLTIKLLPILALLISNQLSADALFSDNFESADLSHIENGISYHDSEKTSVSSLVKKSGTYSLEFRYPAAAFGSDSFAEQRLSFPQTNELWIKYDLYIPVNYTHRSDSPSNNKFLAIFRTPYRTPGFQINWSTGANGSGGSNLGLYRYRNGSEQTTIAPSDGIGNDFLTSADRGNWVEIVAHVKVPSSADAADGVMQMWKNGLIVTNEKELNNYGGDSQNYITELYLLGWANSGYADETFFYIDNLEINYAPFKVPFEPTGTTTD